MIGIMLGAIAGDITGSVYEFNPVKTTDFQLFGPQSRFTDDTVLTIATMQAILKQTSFADTYHKWGNQYPQAGYGGRFRKWLESASKKPYNSFGNGSAMRVSPVALAAASRKEVLELAEESAAATHNHPEGIKGAQTTALAIYLTLNDCDKETLRTELETFSGYHLHRSVDSIRKSYSFDVTCQGSVPEAIICYLEAESLEETIRNAISLGGDADTQAAIAGPLAEAAYGIEPFIKDETCRRLDTQMIEIIDEFYSRYSR